MPEFGWDDSYSVGDEEFDAHHKQLIRYIQLLDDPTQKRDPKFMGAIIDGLVAYTNYHFTAEAICMRDAEYPGVDRHLDQHAEFVAEATRFRDSYHGSNGIDADEILEYLKVWLIKHILTEDRGFARFREKTET